MVSHEKPNLYINSPLVAHGNPSAAIALDNLAQYSGFGSRLDLIEATLPQKYYQWISRSPDRLKKHNEKSDMKRRGLFATVFSNLLSLEILRSNPDLIGEANSFTIGLFTQELALSGFHKEELKSLFPKGTYLFINDVFPKDFAIEVMKKTGTRPVVWNSDAYSKLSKEGLNPILSKPWLLGGFSQQLQFGETKQYSVVIKASGSGMPDSFLKGLKTLSDKKLAVKYFLPNPRKSVPHQLEEFYNELIQHPPAILIGFPSEMIQAVADLYSRGWQGRFIALPPKGLHEVNNFEWAVSQGLVSGVLDFGNALPKEICNKYSNKIIDVEANKEIAKQSAYDLPLDIREKLGKIDFYEWLSIFESQREVFREIAQYLTFNWQNASEHRLMIQEKLLELSGFKSMDEFVEKVSEETAVVFIHGGIATRWIKSLDDLQNKDLIKQFNIDPTAARGLARVPNFIPDIKRKTIPMAAYNLFSIQRIAGHLVVIHSRDQRSAIQKEILEPLGINNQSYFVEQIPDLATGKPLGHGDALLQAILDGDAGPIIKKSKFIVTCNGTLPSRRSTVELSLLALYVAHMFGEEIAAIAPTAILPDKEKYPIIMDKDGFPIEQVYNKPLEFGGRPNNIGIFAFVTGEIIRLLESVEKKRVKGYKSLFGSSNFDIGHISRAFMDKRKLRILNIASPREIQNDVKTVEQLPNFVEDIRQMMKEDFG